MKIGIIIPAHNEEKYLEKTLNSLLNQTHKAMKIIVVDDNSTDKTSEICKKYQEKFPEIHSIYFSSSKMRLPGSKVVTAFNKGLSFLSQADIICKFDADLVFPENYLEQMIENFQKNEKLGMWGGVCSIEKNGEWQIENLTNLDHLRGPIKAYRKACFEQIGGLKPAMGWDTADELLARYYGWEVVINPNLQVKHLRPTAFSYHKKAQPLQGQVFYSLRYGTFLGILACAKLAYRKGQWNLFVQYLDGYFKAEKANIPFLVSEEEGKWIRKYRWKGIFSKIWK